MCAVENDLRKQNGETHCGAGFVDMGELIGRKESDLYGPRSQARLGLGKIVAYFPETICVERQSENQFNPILYGLYSRPFQLTRFKIRC